MLSSLSIPRSLPRNERGSWHCSISPKLKSDHHRAYSHCFNAFPTTVSVFLRSDPPPHFAMPSSPYSTRAVLLLLVSLLATALASDSDHKVRSSDLPCLSVISVSIYIQLGSSNASVDLLIGVSFLDGPRSSCNSRKILLIKMCLRFSFYTFRQWFYFPFYLPVWSWWAGNPVGEQSWAI